MVSYYLDQSIMGPQSGAVADRERRRSAWSISTGLRDAAVSWLCGQPSSCGTEINDHGWPWTAVRYTLFQNARAFFGTHYGNMTETKPAVSVSSSNVGQRLYS